jgi:ABC-type lipoprotein release transport system permease subunit
MMLFQVAGLVGGLVGEWVGYLVGWSCVYDINIPTMKEHEAMTMVH